MTSTRELCTSHYLWPALPSYAHCKPYDPCIVPHLLNIGCSMAHVVSCACFPLAHPSHSFISALFVWFVSFCNSKTHMVQSVLIGFQTDSPIVQALWSTLSHPTPTRWYSKYGSITFLKLWGEYRNKLDQLRCDFQRNPFSQIELSAQAIRVSTRPSGHCPVHVALLRKCSLFLRTQIHSQQFIICINSCPMLSSLIWDNS